MLNKWNTFFGCYFFLIHFWWYFEMRRAVINLPIWLVKFHWPHTHTFVLTFTIKLDFEFHPTPPPSIAFSKYISIFWLNLIDKHFLWNNINIKTRSIVFVEVEWWSSSSNSVLIYHWLLEEVKQDENLNISYMNTFNEHDFWWKINL